MTPSAAGTASESHRWNSTPRKPVPFEDMQWRGGTADVLFVRLFLSALYCKKIFKRPLKHRLEFRMETPETASESISGFALQVSLLGRAEAHATPVCAAASRGRARVSLLGPDAGCQAADSQGHGPPPQVCLSQKCRMLGYLDSLTAAATGNQGI